MMLVFCAAVSGSYAFAKATPSDIKHFIPNNEKTKLIQNEKALADKARMNALEKTHEESISKKIGTQKFLALELWTKSKK